MSVYVRHMTAPTTLGCRWCGVAQRDHARRWVPSKRWHTWEEPTRAQIGARVAARCGIAATRWVGTDSDPLTERPSFKGEDAR